MKPREQKRFYTLDAARGFAALGVLVWHFQHFYYIPGGGLPDSFSRSAQPLYNMLYVFYNYGYFAVQFFFCLSGFIFFWLYLEKVKSKGIDPVKFFMLRFSRLYPLHLATLVAVLVLQTILLTASGNTYVYQNTDVYHFILNMLLANHWGFENGYSFNGPSWSISMEILAYAVFFSFARLGYVKIRHIIGFVSAVILVFGFVNPYITQVIFCFFMGGLAYLLYERYSASLQKKEKLVAVFALFVTSLLFMIHAKDALGFESFINVSKHTHINYALYAVAFPSIILALAFLQDVFSELGKRLKILGDISYGLYLTHFPVQLLIIGVYGALNREVIPGKALLVLFIATTIFVSLLSYKYLELPSQRYLRKSSKGTTPEA